MAIVKNLAFYQKNAFKNLVSLVGAGNFTACFLPFPIDFFNHILPLKFKFSQEAFVVLDNNEVKGLVALEKEPGNYRRLKIIKLFLEENSNTEGEQLINYVISRYCANGANSFQIIFDENLIELTKLFTEVCKFRVSSQEHLYKIEKETFRKTDFEYSIFERFDISYAKRACELYNSCIIPYLRPIFEKKPKYFGENFSNSLCGRTFFKYILKDPKNNSLYGYFSLTTSDNENYVLEGALDHALDSYFIDIIYFSLSQISRRTKKYNLYLRVKKYFKNAPSLVAELEGCGFELVQKSLVLTKDFLATAKENEFKSSRILFDAVSPGF